MRVLYDSLGFLEAYGGVSRSLLEMITHLPAEIEPVLAIKRTCNLALQGEPFKLASYPNQSADFLKGWTFRGKWRLWQLAQRCFSWRWPDYEAENRAALAEHLARGDFDILHLTGAHFWGEAWERAWTAGKKPLVVTVHDLIPEIVQGNRGVGERRRCVLNAATQVIAVSAHTKRDVMRLYGIPDEKITVVHHGWEGTGDCGTAKELDGASWRRAEGSYLLFVGKREGYKNWAWLVEAIAPLLREGETRLICTGSAFTRREQRLLRKLGIAARVEQRFVSDAELAALYRQALAFVSPSTYEGFGLPILEAWAAECPVVLARASCFPEIAGGAALYFEPTGESGATELRRQVRELRERRGAREELIAAGRARLALFSWEKCARETAEVYRKALQR